MALVLPIPGHHAAAGLLVNGGSVSGYLDNSQQTDIYTFDAAAGQSVEVRAATRGLVSSNLTLRLFNPDGSPAEVDGGPDAVALDHRELEAGTYSVHLSISSSSYPATGYELYFALIPGANELGTVSLAGEVSSESVDEGDLDTYTFVANAGENIHVRLTDTSGDPDPITTIYSFQPQLRVYAPGGGFIAQDSDYDVASVVFQAESNGTYTIVASDDDYDPRQAGSYELRVIRAPLEVNGPMLVNGGFVDDHMDAGDLDAFVFMANAGEGIQIRVADLSGDEPDTSLVLFHPAISVYGPNGSSVRIPDTVEGYDVAGFGFDAPQSGKYTAVVRDESRYRDEGGDYRIYLTRAPGANKDGALIDGQIFTGSIELGELDSYTLQARRGDRVTIGSTASSELYYLRKTVYDPLGRQVIVQPYNRTAIFTAERTGTYTVVLADDSSSLAKTGVYSISLDIERNGISYAALGDSYSAGEGVRPYETLDEGWDEGCHRSTRAYSKLLRVPGTSLPISRREDALYDFHACTGAVTNNIRSSGTGQDGEPPQLAAVNHVDSTRDLVTMSLGGNDAHFADILMFCFAHEACNEIRPFEPFSDIQLGDLFPLLAAVVEVKLLDVYAELRAATPNAPTLIMEYPQVVGGEECAAAKVPFADHLALSESEQAWMRDATRQINAVVQAAAAIRGLHFVPVAEHFDGHEVCGRYDDWILGLNLIDRERLWDPNASFHPTARGQYELARVANSYLESISTGWPFGYHASGLPRNPSPLLPVAQFAGAEPTSPLPSFGDLNVSFANAPQACAAVGGTITPGAIVALRGVGFAPNESIQISLKLVGEASVVLGNVAADDEGGLDAVFDLPESLKVGGQGALQALGAGPDGVGRLLLALVQIQSSLSVDGDGDGVPDSCDNCPNTSNTDQSDLDFDGRGDTCDLCSQDPDNDQDGDGLCAIFDACPLDPYNDIDGDGHCALEDNCAITYNPDQADGDGDGIGDACEELACYPVSLVVHQAGAGNVTADATNCGLDAYFEGTHVGLRADSEPGQFFTGWSGDLSTAENPFSVTVTADTTLIAHFCSETTDSEGDLVADACDNCPADPNSDQQDNDGDGSGNACDNDDDNDGLLDIYETNTGVYISPTDTGTDPLSVDTDGDGIDDFQEIQQGTDPTVPNTRLEISLKSGFNLISYPFDSEAGPISCVELLDQLGGVDAGSIQKFDAATQHFVNCELATSAAFSMRAGEGYVINSREDVDVALSGEVICPELRLEPGINLIGNPSPAADLGCYELLVGLGSRGVKSIQHHDPVQDKYESCALSSDTRTTVGVDFTIRKGEGYIVHSSERIQIAWPRCTL